MGLSTHVLDTMHGCPAAGMSVALYTTVGDDAQLVRQFVLNSDGRSDGPLYDNSTLKVGTYRLVFDVADLVKVNGAAPVLAYKVRLYRAADGILVAQTWSAPATGTYTFGDLELDQTYVPVALDHTGTHKPVAAGPLTPEADA